LQIILIYGNILRSGFPIETDAMLKRLFVALPLSLALVPASFAADPVEFKLVIKDHRFRPAELKVPAGQKIRLVVENQDPTPEEFESYTLNREKIVPGKSKITVMVGPLKPGRYEFFGEFNMDTAQGVLVAQ
jgi:hypothetical protein